MGQLDKLKLKNGGSIIMDTQKSKLTSTPTLLIGLGGLGCKTLNQIKRKVLAEFEKLNPDIIRFVAIDTCKEDLGHIVRDEDGNNHATAFLEQNEYIPLFDPSITNVFDCPVENRKPYLRKWVRDSYRPDPVRLDSAGARQTRQLGRVMLAAGGNYDRVKNSLVSYINPMVANCPPNTAMEVIIVAGISGGTGSGTIVDISYMIHDIFAKNIKTANYKLNAYLYTPDVQTEDASIRTKAAVVNNLKRNGYAALKEIDYFMNLQASGDSYRLDYDGGYTTSKENIYSDCTLITGFSYSGGILGTDAVVESVAESIRDLLSNVSIQQQGGNSIQLNEAFLSNKTAMVGGAMSAGLADPSQYPKAANYRYKVIGHADVNIPKVELMTYCANLLLRKMKAEYDKFAVSDDEILDALRSGSLDSMESFCQDVCSFAKMKKYDLRDENGKYPELKKIQQDKDGMLEDMKNQIRKNLKLMTDDMINNAAIDIIERIKKHVNIQFRAKGPYFAQGLYVHILDGIERGILPKISRLDGQLESLCTNAKEYARLEKCEERIKKSRNELRGGFLGSGNADKAESFARLVKTEAIKGYFDPVMYRHLQKILALVHRELVHESNSVFDVYVNLIDELMKLLQEDSDYVTSSEFKGSVFSMDIVDIRGSEEKHERLKKYLAGFVDEDSVTEMKNDMIKSMIEHREEWTAQGAKFRGDIIVQELFDTFFTKHFETVLEKFLIVYYSGKDLSMDEVNNIWKDNEKRDSLLQGAARDVISYLNVNSQPMANMSGDYQLNDFPSKKYISLMPGLNHVNACIQAAFPSGSGVDVGTAKQATRISVSSLYVGLPLFVLAGFEDYDETYERLQPVSKALHIDEGVHPDGEGQNWLNLPQPYDIEAALRNHPEKVNQRELGIQREIKKRADRGIALGCIQLDASNKFYNMFQLKDVKTLEGDIQGQIFSKLDALYRVAKRENSELTAEEYIRSINLGVILQAMNVALKSIEIDPRDELMRLEKTDLEGAHNASRIGDFYKIVRKFTNYQLFMNKALEQFEQMAAAYDAAAQQLLNLDKYQERIMAFINMLKTGRIYRITAEITEATGNSGAYWYYNTADNKITELVCLVEDSRFDKRYELYHCFVALMEMDASVYTSICRQNTQDLRSGKHADMQWLIGEYIEPVVKKFNLPLQAENINNEARTEARRAYTVTKNAEDIGNTFEVLHNFYNKLMSELSEE